MDENSNRVALMTMMTTIKTLHVLKFFDQYSSKGSLFDIANSLNFLIAVFFLDCFSLVYWYSVMISLNGILHQSI